MNRQIAIILNNMCEKIHFQMLEAQNTHHLPAELVLKTAIGAIGAAARLSMPKNENNPTLRAMAIATLIDALVDGFNLKSPAILDASATAKQSSTEK